MKSTHYSQAMHQLPFGANLNASGRTHFRFWAPSQQQVRLEIDGGPPLPMKAADDGVFEAEVECGAGAIYRYILDDGEAVPDPASRAQHGSVHGGSKVIDPRAYRWRHSDWRGRPWHEAVIYELHPGACGGFSGATRLLPQLAQLGVTAVELMPVADFPGQRNWGYDGVLPYAPASAYGSPEQLKTLVDEAHGLGLMVFLDVVYNHFGPDGCYLHRYAPQFFRSDVQTPWGDAIDFRQAQVRDYFRHNALYWLLEYRIDGLRLDAVHAIEDEGWLEETAQFLRQHVDPPPHLVLENDDNNAELLRSASGGYCAQWNDDIHHALHVLLSDESEGYYRNFADDPTRHLTRCLTEGFAYQGEYSPSHERRRGTPSGDLSPLSFVAFLQNHDQIGNRAFGERLTRMVGRDALHAATALLLLSPQIPLLFMGQEWGSKRPFYFFTDHHGELAEAVRQGRRREFMQFSSFSEVAPELIPDPNMLATFSSSIPDFEARTDGDGAWWLARHQRLLALRRQWLMPRLDACRVHSLGAERVTDGVVKARWRLADGGEWTLVSNLSRVDVNMELPPGKLIYDSNEKAAARNRLPAYCTRVYLGGQAA